MTAHLAVPSLEPDGRLPASLSPVVVGSLRALVGPDRLIFSDDLEMGAVMERYGTPEAAKLAFLAGSDILLFRRDVAAQRQAHALLVEAVQSGEISTQQLDASVRRILRAKLDVGLLDGLPLPVGALDASGGPENAGVAGEVARQALTLVRNEGNVFPLRLGPGQRLCVIGPRSAEVAQWEVNPAPAATTLGTALAERHPLVEEVLAGLSPSPVERERAAACAARAAAVVVGTYDVHQFGAQASLVRAVLATGRPTVVVALRLPYDLAHLGDVPAYLATYSIRPASLRAAAAALLGEFTPSGRLPVPLLDSYPFGFGLLAAG
jgi:beta-N-acetylhexosaminidase